MILTGQRLIGRYGAVQTNGSWDNTKKKTAPMTNAPANKQTGRACKLFLFSFFLSCFLSVYLTVCLSLCLQWNLNNPLPQDLWLQRLDPEEKCRVGYQMEVALGVVRRGRVGDTDRVGGAGRRGSRPLRLIDRSEWRRWWYGRRRVRTEAARTLIRGINLSGWQANNNKKKKQVSKISTIETVHGTLKRDPNPSNN